MEHATKIDTERIIIPKKSYKFKHKTSNKILTVVTEYLGDAATLAGPNYTPITSIITKPIHG